MPSAIEPLLSGKTLRTHGGIEPLELRALGFEASELIDFSVSCNPYGPCEEVVHAVRSARIDRYPDPRAHEARAALARWLDRGPAQIVLGNGAAELLWMVAQTLVAPKTEVVIAEPTFGEFRAAVEHRAARVHEWRAAPEDGFAIDLGAIERLVRERNARVLYLCAPNSPTGAALPASEIMRFAVANPELVIVLDQSFLSLSTRHAEIRTTMPANVICVRSLTKDHALPGIRVGYLIATPDLATRFELGRPAWPTSAVVQSAAIAACRAAQFVDSSRERVLEDCAYLDRRLRELGLYPIPSSGSFLLVRTGDAASLRDKLLSRHRVLVRDCSSFGLPDYIRVAARPRADCEKLERALEQELPGC